MDIVAGLRMIERLLAVGIGGMSIYLGYHLFLALPAIRDASGIALCYLPGCGLNRY